jgi:hypothetical protein
MLTRKHVGFLCVQDIKLRCDVVASAPQVPNLEVLRHAARPKYPDDGAGYNPPASRYAECTVHIQKVIHKDLLRMALAGLPNS